MSKHEKFIPLALALAAANKTIEELRAELASREDPWKPIADAPETGEDILCCFLGPNCWIYFTAPANGPRTHSKRSGFRSTHWRKLEPPK